MSAPQVNLLWQLVSGANSYNVKRGTTQGGPYTNIATGVIPAAGATEGSFSDTTVVRGDTYFYVVTAVDASGHESAPSNEVSATIPNIAAPTGLTAQEVG